MSLKFSEPEWEKIHHANRCLDHYMKSIELENKAKQDDLASVAYNGMPNSPTKSNYVEDRLVSKSDAALKYHQFQLNIQHTLDNVIWIEDPLWYQLLTRRYLKFQTHVKICMELHISKTTYYEKLNQALLHFDNASSLDMSIFD